MPVSPGFEVLFLLVTVLSCVLAFLSLRDGRS